MKVRGIFWVVVLLIVALSTVSAQQLVINSYMADEAPRRVFAELVDQFRAAYPQYQVTVNTFPHEDFKTLIRTWLPSANPPDVVTWFAGERMRYFADRGLLEPINDVFEGGFEQHFPAAFASASAYKDNYYFVPQSWYWWGVYYNTKVFDELGLTVPENWYQFLKTCEVLKENGYTPIAIGTKWLWTTGGWFDYLNMRLHGLEFHTDLTAGIIPYTDPRVEETLSYLADLARKGYFLENHSSYDWQEAATRLFNGEAGMYLMGQFIKDVAPAAVKDDLDFFRFPVIDGRIGVYEDTPIDGLMIPKNARNKGPAKDFLRFIASVEAQEYFAVQLGRLAANRHVPAPDADAQRGLDMILASDGVMQFYDRDTDPEMADRGMNAFVELMMFPDRLQNILRNLERERQRIF